MDLREKSGGKKKTAGVKPKQSFMTYFVE